jgi:hypothetical protein
MEILVFSVSEGYVMSYEGVIPQGFTDQDYLEYLLDKAGVELSDIGISGEFKITVYGGTSIDIEEIYEPAFESYEIEE